MNVPVSGAVIGEQEKNNLIAVANSGWLTDGVWTHQFEKILREFIGVRYAITCNSGSSANLLALTTLTAIELGDKRLLPGDEVITVAAGFPTTINPIIQVGCIPVFVDITIPEYNIDITRLNDALNVDTKAVMIAHTLGRPFDIDAVQDFCERNGLWLIEDCCDALGSEYHGEKLGSFGDIGTGSFFPAHNITTGEGGIIFTDSPILAKIIKSFRNWGKDCWCNPGESNTCGKRFNGDYDHKYTFSRVGYNLAMTDMQAAIGCGQMNKLHRFNAQRIANYRQLYNGLRRHGAQLILSPYVDGMVPFGFPITCMIPRKPFVNYLEANGIATRPLFAGNITRQPSMAEVEYRLGSGLHNTDIVHDDTIWIGCWHGLNAMHMDYVIAKIGEYLDGLE